MKSNINVAIVALAAAVSGAVFSPEVQAQAQMVSGEQLSSPDYRHLKSLRSRAEVQAEAVAARRVPGAWSGEDQASFAPTERFVSNKSRQEVAAETLQAIRLGQVSYSGEHPTISSSDRLGAAANRLAGVRGQVTQQ